MIWRGMAGLGVAVMVAGLWLYGVIGPPVTAQTVRIVLPAEGAPDGGRVLILGTSLTRSGTWVEALEARMQSCAPGVTITRLARAGAASGWGETALTAHLQEASYDLVIIEFTANDASLARGLPLIWSRAGHIRMIGQLRNSGAAVFLATMSPAWGQNAWERPGQARYAGLYRDLATQLGTGLIDTRAEWHDLPQADRVRLVPDGLHPTQDGHAQITVPAFAEALAPLVCN